MNRGLVYLLRKTPVGWIRLFTRRYSGAKRLLAGLGIAALVVPLVGSQISLGARMTAADVASGAESLRLWGPPALMLTAMLGAFSGRGLSFRPCEVDFLFPAPIGRRELLLYHVLARLLTTLLSALWLAMFGLRWAPHWYWGLPGILLTSFFIQLTNNAASLLMSTVSVRLSRWVKRAVWLGVVLLPVAGVISAREHLAGASIGEAARLVAGSTPVVVVSAPARVFVEIYASQSTAQFVGWAAAGLAVLGVLFGLVVGFDVAYTDAAVRASRRQQERLRRMRATGSPVAAPASARGSLPVLPWLGGTGPLTWRQGLEAIRSPRAVAFTGLMIIGFPLLFALSPATGDGGTAASSAPSHAVSVSFAMVLLMGLLMTQNLALAFRRDVDRMAYLKSLPLAPEAVVLGQLVPAIAILTVLQAIAIAVIALTAGVARPWALAFLLALVPLNWLSVAIDNVLFLLFPYRVAPAEAAQFRFMGRAMLVMGAKMFALTLGAGAAVLAGLLLSRVAGGSTPFAVGGAALTLGVEAVLTTYLLGRIFGRYDVNKDVVG